MEAVRKPLVDSAKIMAKGQITLPKDFRDAMKLVEGDRLTLVFDGEKVIMINAMKYAMQVLQGDMKGAAKEAGIESEDDITKIVTEMRYGEDEGK